MAIKHITETSEGPMRWSWDEKGDNEPWGQCLGVTVFEAHGLTITKPEEIESLRDYLTTVLNGIKSTG